MAYFLVSKSSLISFGDNHLSENINQSLLHMIGGIQHCQIGLKRSLGLDHVNLGTNDVAILDAFGCFCGRSIHRIQACLKTRY